MEPGKVMPSSWTIMPRNAIMEMRPCLISTCGKSVERRKRPSRRELAVLMRTRPRTARRRASPSCSSQNFPDGTAPVIPNGPGSTPISSAGVERSWLEAACAAGATKAEAEPKARAR